MGSGLLAAREERHKAELNTLASRIFDQLDKKMLGKSDGIGGRSEGLCWLSIRSDNYDAVKKEFGAYDRPKGKA